MSLNDWLNWLQSGKERVGRGEWNKSLQNYSGLGRVDRAWLLILSPRTRKVQDSKEKKKWDSKKTKCVTPDTWPSELLAKGCCGCKVYGWLRTGWTNRWKRHSLMVTESPKPTYKSGNSLNRKLLKPGRGLVCTFLTLSLHSWSLLLDIYTGLPVQLLTQYGPADFITQVYE